MPTQAGDMPAAAPAPQASTAPVQYDSNPFIATLSALAKVITVNPFSALLIVLTFVGVVVGLFIIVGILGAVLGKAGVLAPILIVLIYLFAVPTLTGALASLYLHSAEDKKLGTFELIQLGISKMFPLLGLIILTGLVVGLGFLLFIIPGLIFAAWFSLSVYAMMDENLGPIAAMKRSKSLVKGHVWEIFGSMFSTSLLGSSGLLAPAVASSGLGARYTQLTALKASGQPSPKVHWTNYALPLLGIVFIVGYFALVSLSVLSGVQQVQRKSLQVQSQVQQQQDLFNSNNNIPSQ